MEASNLSGSFPPAVPQASAESFTWAHELSIHLVAAAVGFSIISILFCAAAPKSVTKLRRDFFATIYPYFKFAYVSFFKPHSRDSTAGQQVALESFYKLQADVYDVTRKSLLHGREDMLNLAAAQLKFRDSKTCEKPQRRIWVDIGGGTGYNIEAMAAFVFVPEFFKKIYLVDFSPSLCEIAKKRFQRLGWKNVHVICQDARLFRLEEYELSEDERKIERLEKASPHMNTVLADLVTMSYSLSMIPDFHSVIDSAMSLLDSNGIVCVVDFYVQSVADVYGKTYIGGTAGRHVNWIGRAFWRAWFEADRVNLDPSRRDYLEYRFGTLLCHSGRNYWLGGIPYYLWMGRPKSSSSLHRKQVSENGADFGSLACPASVSMAHQNLSVNLPLPSAFYQNQPWRLHYSEHDAQHAQFADSYIYAFTWEDPVVDEKVLNLGPSDEILAITSAGDNILSYLSKSRDQQPKAVHAVDLNPAQNHLLELKLAAFASLAPSDIWQLFGEGHHPNFRRLLLDRLSPHLSSRAFQFWLARIDTFSERAGGLYYTGGSRHALNLMTWLARFGRSTANVRDLCNASSLERQVGIWESSVRGLLVNKALNWAIVSQRMFLWKALGVPDEQRLMIVQDHAERSGGHVNSTKTQDEAICRYMTDTLDPVVCNSRLSTENYFYLLCLQGHYTKSCRPRYLEPSSHAHLSRPSTLSKVTIHTATVLSVLQTRNPSTLSAAIIMDSMDWFSAASPATDARKQIAALRRALKTGGKVVLRSAARRPWYLELFEKDGFEVRCVCIRGSGDAKGENRFVDRVNMYAGTWICVKV
ncbi:MAG: hypothetical protein M1814_005380 [Vezdaea aestivalis]|nr:MAG: hypothetical protein M1814_005380 [Vezdaea aestivalis]